VHDKSLQLHAGGADPSHDTLRPYVAFHAALRSAYHSFIAHLEDNCKSLMRHHLEAATSEFAVTALAGKLLSSCYAFPLTLGDAHTSSTIVYAHMMKHIDCMLRISRGVSLIVMLNSVSCVKAALCLL